MRRADETMRDHGQLVACGPFTRTKLARAFARDVPEDSPERPEAVPPGLERNVDDRLIGVAQQRLRSLDPPREEVAMRRNTERFLE